MDLKQPTISTEISAFYAEMTPWEAVVALIDPQERALKLYLQKTIHCPTQKHVVFAAKLIQSLSMGPSFPGTATIEQPQQNSSSSKWSYFSEEDMLKHSTTLFSKHRVCYKLESSFQVPPSEAQGKQALQDFSKWCEFTHGRLQDYVKHYRIEKRVKVFESKLEKDLMGYKPGGKLQLQERWKEELFDKRAHFFDSD